MARRTDETNDYLDQREPAGTFGRIAGGGEREERYVPYAGYFDLSGPVEPDQVMR